MDSIKKILKFVDIYGTQMSFTNDDSYYIKSVLGGAFSIFTAILASIIFYIFSHDCFFKMNPTVRVLDIYKDQNLINGSNFFYGLYFSTSNYTIMENPQKYLAFHAVITSLRNSSRPIYNVISFSKCNLSKHFLRNSKIEIDNLKSKLPSLEMTFALIYQKILRS